MAAEVYVVDDVWSAIERLAAVITLIQATPKVIIWTEKLLAAIRKKIKRSRRKK